MVEQSSAVGLGAAQEVIRIALELQAETKGMNKLTATTSRLEKEMERLKNKTGEMQGATQEYFETNIQPQALNTLRESLRASAGSLTGLLRTSRELRPNVEQMGLSMGEFRMEVEAAAQRIRPFKFAFLGLMFIGMQITRVMSGMFRDMFQGFRDAQEANSQFNTAMSRLGAQIQYVKFLFMDAFVNSPLFSFAIQSLERMLNYFAGLDDRTKVWYGTVALIVAALGAALFIIGTVGAAIQSIVANVISLVAWLSTAKAPPLIVALGKAVTWVWALILRVGGALSRVFGTLRGAGIIALVAFFARFAQKLHEFEGDWLQAWEFISAEMTEHLVALLRKFNDFTKFVANLVATVIGGAFDLVFDVVARKINTVLNQLARGLSALGFGGMASTIRGMRIETGTGRIADSIKGQIESQHGTFERMLSSFQESVALNKQIAQHLGTTGGQFTTGAASRIDSNGVIVENMTVVASDPESFGQALNASDWSGFEQTQRLRDGI